MNKHEILSEIKRLSIENDGKAPGQKKFATETGIYKSDWFPDIWLRWSDALIDAGCAPNLPSRAYENQYLLDKLIELIRELSHFPVHGEILLNRSLRDKTVEWP